MSTRVQHKRKTSASGAPLATDILEGEIVLNLVDKTAFSKDAAGTVFQIGSAVTASGFFEVTFEIGNDVVPLDGGDRPSGACLFPSTVQPLNGDKVLIYNSGGDTLTVGIYLYNSLGLWLRAPGYQETDILPSPVIVKSQMPGALYPTLWHIFNATGEPRIQPGQSDQYNSFITQTNYSYTVDLTVPAFAKYVCTVDVVNAYVTASSIIPCGFVPLEDPPEAVNDYEELESMSVSAVALAGSVRFYLYARGSMTGSYRVWYAIN